jgi:histidinol-phosphate aminotransferase
VLRGVIAGLPVYKAGGRPPAGGYKASSNETPFEPLPSVVAAIEAAAREMNRYPDPASTSLVTALAERFGVAPERIALGTGSVGIAQQIVQSAADADDEVLYAWRSFEAYPIITAIAGATPVQVPLDRGDVHDLDEMFAAVSERTRVVFVCNPNNPTSTAVGRDELTRFLDKVPEHILVVLDEAYREYVADPDVPDGLAEYGDRPNICVLRTFSKAYGLAGLRVGFAVAHEPVAEALRKTAVPFGVSSIAEAAAVASLAAEPELLARVAEVVAERTRLTDDLRAIGWTVPDSRGNFLWLRLGAATTAFAEACLAQRLVVRPFPGEGIRVTVGDPTAGDVLLSVARAFAESGEADGSSQSRDRARGTVGSTPHPGVGDPSRPTR